MPGTLACTPAGGLIVHVEAERHRIAPEGTVTSSVTIEGHVALNPAGRAVVIRLRAGAWIVPLVSFRRVATGEAASAPLFPLTEVERYE
jgi:hypothetical protein